MPGPSGILVKQRSSLDDNPSGSVFNVKGNKYRSDTRVAYRTAVVVLKRIGTHAEYDGWTFND